jgi:CRISPR system Cascade subunit CasB
MADVSRRTHYWDRHTEGNGRWRRGEGPPGADLAGLRAGLGREAGEVPSMWPYYQEMNAQGWLTSQLRAEHVALTLFAVHQQGSDRPVHRSRTGLGEACRALRDSERYSEEGVNRRFAAAATAADLAELTGHLRGLITQLRTIGQGLDYTRLMWDLRDWQDPERIATVRRRWGGQYFGRTTPPPGQGAGTTSSEPQPAGLSTKEN